MVEELNINYSLEVLKARREMYLDAERKILLGQEYVIGDRRLRRPNLEEVRKAISELNEEIDILEYKFRRFRRAVILDD